MSASPVAPELSVLLATGDPELEGRLVEGLHGQGVAVVARCLDAATLLDAITANPRGAGHIDAVLASATLHGLTEGTLVALRDRATPVLLLAADERQVSRFAELAPALPTATPAEAVAEALRHVHAGGSLPAVPGERSTTEAASSIAARAEPAPAAGGSGRVLAVLSGTGAPGRTTIAIALAAELGRLGETVVLIDADLRVGNVAPYLDLDPRRGLVGLAVGGGRFEERIASELQPGPHCMVLGGVERPQLASALPDDLLAGVIGLLRRRFERVVVDLGVPPNEGALRGADDVLVVTAADLVAVWNTRVALRGLGGDIAARFAVVVNRREGREHYDGDEIQRALGLPVIGTVREDRKAARRAIERQIPLSEAGGRAASNLRALAAAVAGGVAWDAAVERGGEEPARVAVEI